MYVCMLTYLTCFVKYFLLKSSRFVRNHELLFLCILALLSTCVTLQPFYVPLTVFFYIRHREIERPNVARLIFC